MQLSLPAASALLLSCLSGLALAQNTTSSSSKSAEALIRNTLATEAFLLDTRDLTNLGQVYTDDAEVHWTAYDDHWYGLDDIISSEITALNNTFVLMHTYAMSHIDVYDDGTANATSYATWNKFGVISDGYFQQTWAKYFDSLVETDDGSWKFTHRTVEVLFGPLTTNMTAK